MLRLIGCVAVLVSSLAACGGEEFSGSGATGGAAGSAGSAGAGGSAGSGQGGTSGSAGAGAVAGAGGSAGSVECASYCGAAAVCEGGICTLAKGLTGAEHPIADDGFIYWSDQLHVKRAPKSGDASATSLLEIAGANFEFIAADSTTLYAINATQLIRVEKDGTNQVVMLDTLTGGHGVAVDATHVYFTDGTTGKVQRTSKTSNFAAAVESMATSSGAQVITADTTHIYWAADGGMFRCDKSSAPCTPELLSADYRPDGQAHLMLSGNSLYWTYYSEADAQFGVAATLKDGASEAARIFSTLQEVEGLFVAQHVYTTFPNKGEVVRTGLAGPDIETVASGEQPPRGVLVDDQFVYWITYPSGEGELRKMPIP